MSDKHKRKEREAYEEVQERRRMSDERKRKQRPGETDEEDARFWSRVRQRTANASADHERAVIRTLRQIQPLSSDDKQAAQREADIIYDAHFAAIISPFKGQMIQWKVYITVPACVHWTRL